MLRPFLAAAALVAATAAPAAATEVTVPGCYGAVVVACDITIEVGLPVGVETYQTEVPVCAGTCTDVPVTLVRTTSGDPTQVCVSYENRSGAEVFRNCGPGDVQSPYEVGRCGTGNRGVYVYDTQNGYYLVDLCGGVVVPYEVGRCGFKNQGFYVYDSQNGTYLVEACDGGSVTLLDVVCEAWGLLDEVTVEPSFC